MLVHALPKFRKHLKRKNYLKVKSYIMLCKKLCAYIKKLKFIIFSKKLANFAALNELSLLISINRNQ